MTQTTPLNYAPPPPMRRKWRRLVYLFAVIAFLISGVEWGPTAWRRIQIMYWQNKCMNYSAPPDRVVLDWNLDQPNTNSADFNKPWSRYQGLISGNTPTMPPACIFLHAMRRPDGAVRLVSIYPKRYDRIDMALQTEVYQPGEMGKMPLYIPYTGSLIFTGPERIKLFAGQLDPHNPSHLTVDYEIYAKRRTFDVWLGNDDRLLFAERH